MTIGKAWAIIAAVVLVGVITVSGQLVQNVHTSEICVIQDAIDGELHWYTTAGVKPQMFGTVTCYPKRAMYQLTEDIQFNDGGKAQMDGSIQYQYPTDIDQLTKLHQQFSSREAVEAGLVAKMFSVAIYMTGPMMSSTQSYAEEKANLLAYIDDQIKHGIYRTKQETIMVKDPVSEQERWVTVAKVMVDSSGAPLRQGPSALTEFGLIPFNPTLKIHYSTEVEAQIQKQQQAIMDVQIAAAEARKAEQRAKTVEEQGKANTATQRWEQEAIRAKAVTEAQQQKDVATLQAQQRLDVAALAAKESEQYKLSKTLQADGDATYKKRVLEADGALAQKLATLEKIQSVWAEAFARHQGPLVPGVVLGDQAGGNNSVGNVGNLLSMLTAQTAKSLALDMSIPQSGK